MIIIKSSVDYLNPKYTEFGQLNGFFQRVLCAVETVRCQKVEDFKTGPQVLMFAQRLSGNVITIVVNGCECWYNCPDQCHTQHCSALSHSTLSYMTQLSLLILLAKIQKNEDNIKHS